MNIYTHAHVNTHAQTCVSTHLRHRHTCTHTHAHTPVKNDMNIYLHTYHAAGRINTEPALSGKNIYILTYSN